MKKPVYIISSSCISAQETLADNLNFETITNQQVLFAKDPVYKDYIPAAQIRRMSKVVKMSSVAASKALEKAGLQDPDAIIVGTGMGCTEDSEKFLKNVIQNNEEFLTPTYFIQSTHNTVSGQIALALQCHSYNFTYVNSASGLEFSLLDAKLQLENDDAKNILVGAADEITVRTSELYKLNKTIKRTEDLPANYHVANSEGVVWGEGSAFFVLSNKPTHNFLSELIDIQLTNKLKSIEIPEFILNFLLKNNISKDLIDVVILGNSGDIETDRFHHIAAETLPNSSHLYYKHLSGEFNTASGFSFYLANKILKEQHIPEITKLNKIKKGKITYLLIYNNLKGKDHSLTLLRKI